MKVVKSVNSFNSCKSLLDLYKIGLESGQNGVTFDDGEENRIYQSYAEIEAFSESVAAVLQSRKTENAVIGLSAAPSLHTIHTIIGILKNHSVFAFVDLEGSPPALSKRFLRSLGARYVIMDQRELKVLRSFEFHVQVVQELNPRAKSALFLAEIVEIASKKYDYHEWELAYAIQTSGTTSGRPKVIRVPHRCIVPNVVHMRNLYDVCSDDVVFVASPLTFDPSVVDIFLALASGASLLFTLEKVKMMPDRLVELLTVRNRVTLMQVTPSFMKRFGPSRLRNTILAAESCLRVLGLGGEVCPSRSVLRAWKHEQNRTEIYNVYGITEVSSWATIHRIQLDSKEGEDVPLGDVILGTEVQVLGSEAQPIERGEGQLYVGGRERICFIGWEDLSEVSKAPMRNTGDLIRIDVNGRMFYVGRIDDQIKRNGKKVEVKRIETVTKMLPEVEDSYVILDENTQQVILVIVAKQTESVSEVTVKDHLLVNFHDHNPVDRILIVDSIPITRNGKIDRPLLSKVASLQQKTIGIIDDQLSNQEIGSAMKNLWREAIGTRGEIRPVDNFVMLGGNSIQAVNICARIHNCFSTVEFPQLVDKLLNSTLSEVCTYVQSAAEAEKSHPDRTEAERAKPETKRAKPETATSNRIYSRMTCSRKRLIATVIREHIDVQFSVLWQHYMHKCIDASPLVVESKDDVVVYIGSHSHEFAAIALGTGATKWTFESEDRIESSACAALNGEQIFVGGYDQCVYALDPHTGTIQWNYRTGGIVRSSPVFDPITKYVIIGCYDRHVYAFEANSGSCAWRYKPGDGSIYSTPCLSLEPHHRLHVATLDGVVTALCPITGTAIWSLKLNKPVFSSLVQTDSGICFGCVDQKVYCVSHTGSILWSYSTDGPVFSSPHVCFLTSDQATEQEVLMIGSHDSHVHCIEATSGCVKWKSPALGAPVYATPTTIRLETGKRVELDAVVCLNTSGQLFLLSPADGSILAESQRFPGDTFSSPVAQGNRIVFGCRDNFLYCLEVKCV